MQCSASECDFYTESSILSCSSLNIDGISKRVVYSESVNKMLQRGIEKSNFPTVDSTTYVNLPNCDGCNSLNIDGVSKRVVYVMHQQDRLLLSQLHPLSLQFGQNEEPKGWNGARHWV